MFGSDADAAALLLAEGAGFSLAMAILFWLIHYSADYLAIEYDDGDEEKQRKERLFVRAILAGCVIVLLIIVKLAIVDR
jgi:uncharacterized membrane protein